MAKRRGKRRVFFFTFWLYDKLWIISRPNAKMVQGDYDTFLQAMLIHKNNHGRQRIGLVLTVRFDGKLHISKISKPGEDIWCVAFPYKHLLSRLYFLYLELWYLWCSSVEYRSAKFVKKIALGLKLAPPQRSPVLHRLIKPQRIDDFDIYLLVKNLMS